MRVVGPRAIVSDAARRRAAVVARGGGAPAARGARARPAPGRRGARRVRPGGVVRGAARRHRGRRGRPAAATSASLVDAGVVVEVSDDQFWFSHALVADAIVHQLLGRERRRLHERCFEAVRRAPVLDHASLAYHAQGADRHDEVPAIARRGAARYLEKGLTFSALRLAAEGLAEAPNDPELLAVATEAAWRLDFVDEALATAMRWVKVAVEAARPHRAPCGSSPGCTTSSTTRRPRWPASASSRRCGRRSTTSQLRGVAAWSLAQVHMISGRVGRGHRRGPSGRSPTPAPSATRSPRRARSSSGPARGRRPAAAGVARGARTRRSTRPAGRATPCC